MLINYYLPRCQVRRNFQQFLPSIATALSFLAGAVQAASPVVLVEFNGQYRGYFEPPRLSSVLLGINADKPLYWPSARLYKLDVEHLVATEKLRAQVLEQLRLLTIHWQAEPRVAADLMQLRSQIATWRLGQHIDLLLDVDKARTQPDFDPRLDEGQYLIQARSRPGFITLTGLGGDHFVEHQTGRFAYMYLAQAHGIDHSGIDEIYWLNVGQPSTTAAAAQPMNAARPPLKLPIASWNRNQQQLPPGALLFVPIPAKWLPEAWQDLNQQLLQLIQSRVSK
jgi:hypothetical protein